MGARTQALRRGRRHDVEQALDQTPTERLRDAGQLYLELASMLSPQQLERDNAFRRRAKRQFWAALARLRT